MSAVAPSETAAYEAALERLNLETSVRARIARYLALLARANTRTNLTAARTPEALVEHVADSLALVPLAEGSFADIGSGGGFPAFPIGIASGVPGLLVESVVKKARFLEETAATLGLPFTVTATRAEAAGHDPHWREHYAFATARAVGGITTVLELTLPFVALGGRVLLQRGRTLENERRALADAALVLGGRIEREVAGEDERRIFVIAKERATAARFPRRSGIPDRRPLGLVAGPLDA